MHPPPPPFDVQVRVQRAFSFEELQSGSYFASLDESDLQFYRVYGQPVLIPPPEEDDANFVLHTAYPPYDSLHAPCPSAFSSKSYTLLDPLGEGPKHTPLPTHDWQPVKQEPSEGPFPNPALPAIACHLYTIPDHDDVASPLEVSAQYLPEAAMYGEPPMDSLPYPPPANATSPPFFQSPQPQDPFVHDTEWEDRLTVPSQSYMLGELSSPPPTAFAQTLPQRYTPPSVTRSHRRRSHSPTPPLRLSPVPHTKRSLDKKPALACLFCRGRKIACGPPQPGSKDKTCNQCARRHLKCEYPLESRRGMRKRRSLIPRTSSPETNPDGSRVHIVKTNRKRSVDKS